MSILTDISAHIFSCSKSYDSNIYLTNFKLYYMPNLSNIVCIVLANIKKSFLTKLHYYIKSL